MELDHRDGPASSLHQDVFELEDFALVEETSVVLVKVGNVDILDFSEPVVLEVPVVNELGLSDI